MSEWTFNNSMGDSLEHHGILGMHWGIRRFQPYPKGEKKGKEVGEAAKDERKKKIKKKIITTAAVSAAIAAVAVTSIKLKDMNSGRYGKKGYEDFRKLFGPEGFGKKEWGANDSFHKEYYVKGLDDRIKKNPMFKRYLSDADKMLWEDFKRWPNQFDKFK